MKESSLKKDGMLFLAVNYCEPLDWSEEQDGDKLISTPPEYCADEKYQEEYFAKAAEENSGKIVGHVKLYRNENDGKLVKTVPRSLAADQIVSEESEKPSMLLSLAEHADDSVHVAGVVPGDYGEYADEIGRRTDLLGAVLQMYRSTSSLVNGAIIDDTFDRISGRDNYKIYEDMPVIAFEKDSDLISFNEKFQNRDSLKLAGSVLLSSFYGNQKEAVISSHDLNRTIVILTLTISVLVLVVMLLAARGQNISKYCVVIFAVSILGGLAAAALICLANQDLISGALSAMFNAELEKPVMLLGFSGTLLVEVLLLAVSLIAAVLLDKLLSRKTNKKA